MCIILYIGRMKALFLNEVARMYSHIDDTELAARFYRMACDAALDKSRDSVTIQQICGQTQMLLANLNDQGLVLIYVYMYMCGICNIIN